MKYLPTLTLGAFVLISTGATSIINNKPVPSAKAETVKIQQCPQVRVSCPDSVAQGDTLTFTVDVSGGDNNVTPTFNWTVSAGSLTSGQGTSVVTHDTDGLGGQTVTATVDIGGYDRSCSTSDSCTTSVLKKSVKIVEYGKATTKEEKAFLDKFATELQNDSFTKGYIMVYGGRQSSATEAQTAVDKSLEYLIKQHRIDVTRIMSVNGGYREAFTVELWMVPEGAYAPAPAPTLDPKDVKATNTKTKQASLKSKKM